MEYHAVCLVLRNLVEDGLAMGPHAGTGNMKTRLDMAANIIRISHIYHNKARPVVGRFLGEPLTQRRRL
ncbi:hypothetical protein KL936_002376 [Ogataea polymorpha]|nr:hypothetical protein KL936_002376 [Ogataea polymorpha]